MEFYGRQDVLDILDKRASALSKGYRQNIAIIGDELIGKTYLIQHWCFKYCNNFVVCVYVEAGPQDIGVFAEKFAGTLLFSFLKNSQIALKDDMDFLIEKSEKYIPQTAKLIRELVSAKKRKNSPDSFIKVLELAESFYKETGKHCIIIFDEFHLLGELKVKDIYGIWRKQIMLNKNTMYILLSSKKMAANKILSSDLDLLFGNFEKIELQVFDNETAQAFVHDKFRRCSVPPEISDFVVNFSFCHPFYLNAICNVFVDYLAKHSLSSPAVDSLVASLENIFIDSWGILNRRFLQLLEDVERQIKDPLALKILISLASGLSRISQITRQLSGVKKDVSAILNQLCALDLVFRNADVYCLGDRVFGFWLRCIYANRHSGFSVDCEKQKDDFKKELKRLFAHFCDAQTKVVSARILELFNQFGNESIEVHKKRLRLNRFKEVKLLNIDGKQIKEGILARAKSILWIAGLKEDRVAEEDIVEFVGICKRFKYNKSQKRIFITFSDMDANASLIAKEEKIITWDMAFVNSLLDIYDKPRIVK